MMSKRDEEKIVTVDQLPDDPLKMPPPHWRGGGVFFTSNMLFGISKRCCRNLPVHAETERRLDQHFAKYE
jgi:hypothetical protein